eukprot:TRINITY_DN427_c0_g2_i6.p1 TRINITY_DN427_c0_g2~~TRINITY_DN427_c0_g2_i6.p1  ORF type:complete len:409 (+),score=75.13 TRINITY_DN427_c0_g2_i6:77-1303(+)
MCIRDRYQRRVHGINKIFKQKTQIQYFKMKYIILLLCICGIFATKMTLKNTLMMQQKFQEIEKTPLGKMLVGMVELHMAIGGPVEELMNAVDEFLAELETKRQRETAAYEMLREEFLDLIQGFQTQLARAKLDIATAQNKIEVVLEPRLEHLEESIAQMQTNMEENRETYTEEKEERDKKHQHYEKNAQEYKMATIILQECIEQISNLRFSTNSFVQMNKAKRSIEQLKKTVVGQDNQFAPLINALMQLGEGPAPDEQFISQVVELLKDCESQVEVAAAAALQQENKESEDWEEREQYLNAEYNTFLSRKKEYEDEHKVTQDKIASEKKFKEDRQLDYQQLMTDLKRENEEFQQQTDIHNRCIIRIENDHNLTLLAKQNILQHSDQLNQLADTKRKAVDWKNSKKLWD